MMVDATSQTPNSAGFAQFATNGMINSWFAPETELCPVTSKRSDPASMLVVGNTRTP
jgi:hypothetical protein